jgi:tetratricopeptide (TPR) repeat protein
MPTQIHPVWLHRAIVFVTFCGLIATACCPPYCDGIPVTETPQPGTSVGEASATETSTSEEPEAVIPEPEEASGMTPRAWHSMFDQSAYEEIIAQTSVVIETAAISRFYAEARLYRGLAEVYRNGDLDSARNDLAIAEELMDQLTSVDPKTEKTLLFLGKMVLNAKLGADEVAKQYREKAIELAPDQRELIEEEFMRAIEGH